MMKKTLIAVLAIMAFFVFAQNVHAFDIAHGTAWQRTLIVTGWNPWGFPEFEMVEQRAVNVIVQLEWFNPETEEWLAISDYRTNGDGEYYFWHPEIDRGEFRVIIYGNPPSQEFYWDDSQRPETIDYYYWFY